MAISVLFDMDGVLVDSEPVINAASICGLAEYGVHAVPEDFTPFTGTGEDRYIGGVAEKYGVMYVSEMKTRVYEIYLEIVEKEITYFPGVHEMLSSLVAAGIKIALASSADWIKVDANLKAAGIDTSLFSVILSGEDVERKKPWPDIYLLAAKRLGVEPSTCVVVEDALSGIRAAKDAGMKCVAVTTSFDWTALAVAKADCICASLDQVRDKLLALHRYVKIDPAEMCRTVLAQEEAYQFESFNAADALVIGLEACRIAKEEYRKPVSVHIELDAYSLFTHFMDGSDAHNLFWVTVKKNVVKKFGHSSLYMEQECLARGTTFREAYGLNEDEFRAAGGCFPIAVRGKGRIGTITVSNLTGEEDHALAVEAVKRFLKK